MHRVGIAIAVSGLALIVMAMLGIILTPFATVSLPQSYSGNQVIDFSSCTGGYAQGSCNTLTYSWSAPLTDPTTAAAIWNARFAGTPGYVSIAPGVTCGFGALYTTNLPAFSQTQAKYVPFSLPSGIGSWFTVGSVVYLQSNSEYPCASNVGLVQTGSQYTQTTVTTASSTTVTVSGSPTVLPPPPGSPVPPQQPPVGQYALGGFLIVLGGVFYSKDAVKRGLRM